MAGRLRVDKLTISIKATLGDKEIHLLDEDFNPEPFVGFGPEELFELKRRVEREVYVKPSFFYITTQALEADPAGPEGTNHTMDQIQDWYHRRWVPPFALECTICGHLKAAHGPSHSCKVFTCPS